MKRSSQLFVITSTLLLSATVFAQDASDVEIKAYGSYAGGKFDTIDLATGNLFLDIPLLSYPQRGKLPPLTFGIGLNNAPYTRYVICYPDQDDANESCDTTYARYDTSAPGASFGYGVEDPYVPSVSPISGKIGAYITSSYEGSIVNGTVSGSPSQMSSNGIPILSTQLLYSLVDPVGKTHALESGTDNLNVYHAQDGSGWTFLPAGPGNAYDNFDPANGPYWLSGTRQNELATGVRAGTVLSPTGIQYGYQFLPEPSLTKSYQTAIGQTYSISSSLLNSTATDPSGNTLTRGPWYWTASDQASLSDLQAFYSTPSNQPVYVDSIGRTIPDIVSLQETMQGSTSSGPSSCPTGTTSLVWNPPGPGGSPLTYTFCYTQMTLTLALSGSSQRGDPEPESGSMNVLTSLVLPNATQWTFTYDPQTTNLLRVGLPTGGSISYTYQVVPVSPCLQTPCEAVKQRIEDDGLGHISTKSYTFAFHDPYGVTPYYTTTETDNDNNDTVHTFSNLGGYGSGQVFETKTAYYQGTATTTAIALRSVSTTYDYQWDFTAAGGGFRAIGVLPTRITTTRPTTLSQIVTGAPSLSTNVTRSYSAVLFTGQRIACSSSPTVFLGDNPSSCTDHLASPYYLVNSHGVKSSTPNISYYEPTSETALEGRRTTTTQYQFQADSRYKAANMISLPQSVQVQDLGAYVLVPPPLTTTTYRYDEQGRGPQGVLGNLTSQRTDSFMNGSGGTPTFSTSTGTIYNSTGMPTASIDASGNTTSLTYDATGLFVSSIQRPMTNGVPHTDYYSYDPNLGYLNWHTDENGSSAQDSQHTISYTHDVMGRVTGVQYPDSSGSTFCYTDVGSSLCPKAGPPYKLYTSTGSNPDPAVLTIHSYDGLGRVVQSSVASDPLGADIVDTAYDFAGRVRSVSNSYRVSSDPNSLPVPRTYYSYDALGRKITQTQPDGSSQHWCYDGMATDASQTNCSKLMTNSFSIGAVNWVDFSDELGKHVQHATNALGQLVGVMEPSPGTGALSLETDYYNDAFGDLLTVSQLGSNGNTPRTRWFSYYAPSLVQKACNPETLAPGQTCTSSNANGVWYSYYSNGNVKQKTDNRGVSANYIYDPLNRLTSKTYSDQATPSSCYLYDTASNGHGRLASMWTQSAAAGACSTPNSFWSKTTIIAYDSMGRVLNQQQCTPSNCPVGGAYSSSYTYNLAGKVSTYTNGITPVPGGGSLQFTNAYDAAGRLQTLSGNWNDGLHPGTLFSAQAGASTPCSNSTLSYSPSGGLLNATLGNGLSVNRSYDQRLRTNCEVDMGYGANQPATSGFGLVQLTGKEQVK